MRPLDSTVLNLLQKKVDADAAQLLGKAHVRTAELEKQVS